MQIAFVSDIHSNLQAWNAVLLDIRSLNIGKIVCLGDIVGYGPDPAEVLASVHENVAHFVMGNHDAAICGMLDEGQFNDEACSIIRWTRNKLNSKAVKFLGTLPLTAKSTDFICAHGEFSNPGAFNYLFEAGETAGSFQSTDMNLMFVGHTHLPAIFAQEAGNTPVLLDAQDFVIEDGFRYIVNPGSVGSPRDGNFRASYCIYETDTKSIFFRNVAFDISAFRKSMEKAGISMEPSCFLNADPMKQHTPIRERLDFKPADSDSSTYQRKTGSIESISTAKPGMAKYFLGAGLLGLLLSASCLVFKPGTDRVMNCADGTFAPKIDAMGVPVGTSIVDIPDSRTAEDGIIPGWKVLHESEKQDSVTVLSSNSISALQITCNTQGEEVRIVSPAITCKPGGKFSIEGLMQKSADFSGSTYFSIGTYNGKTYQKDAIIKQPAQHRKGGWLAAKQTWTIPDNCTSFDFSIVAKGFGTVLAKDINIERKQ